MLLVPLLTFLFRYLPGNTRCTKLHPLHLDKIKNVGDENEIWDMDLSTYLRKLQRETQVNHFVFLAKKLFLYSIKILQLGLLFCCLHLQYSKNVCFVYT